MQSNQGLHDDHEMNTWASNSPQPGTSQQAFVGALSYQPQDQPEGFVNSTVYYYNQDQVSYAASATHGATPWLEQHYDAQGQQQSPVWSLPYHPQPAGYQEPSHSDGAANFPVMSPFPPSNLPASWTAAPVPQSQYHYHNQHQQYQQHEQYQFYQQQEFERGTPHPVFPDASPSDLVAPIPAAAKPVRPRSGPSHQTTSTASSNRQPGAGDVARAAHNHRRSNPRLKAGAAGVSGGAAGVSGGAAGVSGEAAGVSGGAGRKPTHVGRVKNITTAGGVNVSASEGGRTRKGAGRNNRDKPRASHGESLDCNTGRRGGSHMRVSNDTYPRGKNAKKTDTNRKDAIYAQDAREREKERERAVPKGKGKGMNRKGRRLQQRQARGPLPYDPANAQRMAALSVMAFSGFCSVKGLERTCVELSNACREGAPWSVKVSRGLMPPHLEEQFWRPSNKAKAWKTRANQESSHLKGSMSSPSGNPSRLIPRRMVKCMQVARPFKLLELIWPIGIERVEFSKFDCGIEKMEFPVTLTEIWLSGIFNQPIERVKWPPRLRVLHLSNRFDKPVEQIKLPDSVECITFGDRFNQRILGVKWPLKLEVLEFGAMFNKPLKGITWPETLKELKLPGPAFNQPIHRSPLPRNLEVLRLGDGFDQPLKDVVWPKGLKEVNIGESFDHDLSGVKWPKTLERITAPPDLPLGMLPQSCAVIVLQDLEDQIEDDVASIMSHFMMGGFLNPFDPFDAIHEFEWDYFDDENDFY